MDFFGIVGGIALAIFAWRSWAKVKHLPDTHPRRKRGNAAALTLGSLIALVTLFSLAGNEDDTWLFAFGFVAWVALVWHLKRGLPSEADVRAYEAAQPQPTPQAQVMAAPEPPAAAMPARPLPQPRMREPEIPTFARPLPRNAPPVRPLPQARSPQVRPLPSAGQGRLVGADAQQSEPQRTGSLER